MWKLLCLILSLNGILSADMLPVFDGDPWTGWYCGTSSRSLRVGVQIDGKIVAIPMSKKRRAPLSSTSRTSVTISVVEQSGGKRPKTHKIKKEGWEAITPATDKASKIQYKGTTTHGTVFEVILNTSTSGFTATGHIVDPGQAKGDLQLQFLISLPRVYSREKDEERTKKQAAKDRISLVNQSGEKLNYKGTDKANLAAPEIMGEGYKEYQISYSRLNARLSLEASPGSLLKCRTNHDREIYLGHSFYWAPVKTSGNRKNNAPTLNFTWR